MRIGIRHSLRSDREKCQTTSLAILCKVSQQNPEMWQCQIFSPAVRDQNIVLYIMEKKIYFLRLNEKILRYKRKI